MSAAPPFPTIGSYLAAARCHVCGYVDQGPAFLPLAQAPTKDTPRLVLNCSGCYRAVCDEHYLHAEWGTGRRAPGILYECLLKYDRTYVRKGPVLTLCLGCVPAYEKRRENREVTFTDEALRFCV